MATETAWLIEHPAPHNLFVLGVAGPAWWTGGPEWSKDPNAVVRFARKEDAEAVMRGGGFSPHCVATEHQWAGSTAPPSGMDFGQALATIKRGERVRRAGWNGKGMWLFKPTWISLPEDSVHPGEILPIGPSICMKTARDTITVGWLASQADMLAEDWECVPEIAGG